MVLSRTISEINGDFSRTSQVFLTTVYLTSPLRGSACNLVTSDGHKKLERWAYEAEREFWHLKPFGYNSRLWRTDTGRQYRAYAQRHMVKTGRLVPTFITLPLSFFDFLSM